MSSTDLPRRTVRVLHNREVSPTARELRLERAGMEFRAGELVSLHGAGRFDSRDYSIASGTGDDWIDVLYRLVPHGVLTPQLLRLRAGDGVPVSGPCGAFTVRDPARPLVFIATGTGIAPCRAFLRSHPGLRLHVLHGVAEPCDLFYREEFEPAAERYLPCCSRVEHGGFQGRIPARLEGLELPADADFYLCGANEMIYEATDLLVDRGVDRARIFHEPYYYRVEA
ncbi:MAG: FAD-binding oxidoreductase [Kiritimatiellia bacterium]